MVRKQKSVSAAPQPRFGVAYVRSAKMWLLCVWNDRSYRRAPDFAAFARTLHDALLLAGFELCLSERIEVLRNDRLLTPLLPHLNFKTQIEDRGNVRFLRCVAPPAPPPRKKPEPRPVVGVYRVFSGFAYAGWSAGNKGDPDTSGFIAIGYLGAANASFARGIAEGHLICWLRTQGAEWANAREHNDRVRPYAEALRAEYFRTASSKQHSSTRPCARSWSAVLSVSERCSREELRAAWKKAAFQHHPDRGGDPEKFKAAKDAYEAALREVAA